MRHLHERNVAVRHESARLQLAGFPPRRQRRPKYAKSRSLLCSDYASGAVGLDLRRCAFLPGPESHRRSAGCLDYSRSLDRYSIRPTTQKTRCATTITEAIPISTNADGRSLLAPRRLGGG
jgi:hypothetical protein